MPPTIRQLAEIPWAILPSTLRQIVDAVQSGVLIQGGPLDPVPTGSATRMGSVSVIPVHGMIEHRADWMMEMFGTGTSVETLRDALRAELADPAVKAIVLDVDSPGGSVAGVTELASEIRSARGGTKPIVAVANTMAASAAYWLAAACDEVVVTPSGQVGAIGIYAVHEDVSRMLDSLGVTMTIISAGPHKVDGNEFEPLTDEARADIQKRVDATYDQFIEDVAAGRRTSVATIREDYGGGRVLTAKDALKAGMVDRIGTLSATVQRLGRSGPISRRMAAAGLGPDLEAAEPPTVDTQTDPPADGDRTIADRLMDLVTEANALVDAVDRRASVRTAAHQPAVSTVTERALRATRDALDALLVPGDPEPPMQAGEPPVVPAPPVAAIPPRFRSRDEWLRHLETR